ncbi:MAG: Mov34/MPN/PAD-1 family protein [Myxococcaceae bacterium]|nr:Mov34/MPN/PAD-1 family protein [Myxococcaceae bacterium]
MPKLTVEALRAIALHVESTYPDEGCGVVLAHADGAFEVRPLTNAYDRYHALDATRYPRTRRTAYLFEPKEWLQVMNALEGKGDVLACVFHSHADVGAYFSQEDQNQAMADGEPVLPGVPYLVVAVNQGKAVEGRLYELQGQTFVETEKYAIKSVP